MRFNDSRRKFPPLANSQTSSKASRERVEGIGVRVWGGKDPVEPNRGNVGRDEVVSIRVFDVVMGRRLKVASSDRGSADLRREDQSMLTKVGLWRVEGEFEGVAGGEDGEKLPGP